MSERERWIVYPLLFLALGAALRDKLAKQTRTKQLVCEQLYIVDADGRPRAELRGPNLRLDLAGPGDGLVTANVVQAGALFEGQRRVSAGGGGMGVSWPQLLGLLQRMGLLRMNVAPGPPAPAPDGGAEGAPPPANPGQDPRPADEAPVSSA